MNEAVQMGRNCFHGTMLLKNEIKLLFLSLMYDEKEFKTYMI